MSETTQYVAAAIFAVAVLHTFSAKLFERLAHRYPSHHGVFHLLGEVEAVFGFWSIILFGWMMFAEGFQPAVEYVDTRNYTEPLFVFAIMVIAASRPVMESARGLVSSVGRVLPLSAGAARYFLLLTLVPLLGSFITEPAAMTLAALMLLPYFRSHTPTSFKYATIGALFVNVSIGGTLTHFAAPPVLMVAAKWQWDTVYMLTHFGWKSAIAVFINGAVVTWLYRDYLKKADTEIREALAAAESGKESIPVTMIGLHLLMIAGVVLFAHHPPIFLGIFLLFMGIATAYPQFQERLILREGLMVAFFLAGLVVLGGMQAWWLQPLLSNMSPTAVYYGATALTAITDNAALTYLGSLVEGLSEEFKYALVAGAVTGGGLTIIANAPNPAGAAILRRQFEDENINPLGLLAAALAPTVVTILCFQLL
jgi:Na+/H+ antiporter NhaD/arsenite permease-like protein